MKPINNTRYTLLNNVSSIISRVRIMYGFVPEMSDILKQTPTVELKAKDNGEFELLNIAFRYYEDIIITNKGIWFHPEHGSSRRLMEFNDLEDFFSKTKDVSGHDIYGNVRNS